MKRVGVRPPSWGFLLILLTGSATVALFAWGFSEPRLHRAWDLMARLEYEDAGPPTAAELAAVSRVLADHPEWASTLAAGRPFAVLEAPESGCVRFETSHLMVPASDRELHLVLVCPDARDLDVVLEADGMRVAGRCGPQPVTLTLPGARRARLIPVRRSPGPNFGDDRTCPVFLVPRADEAGDGGDSAPGDTEPSDEGGNAEKD